MEECLIHRNLEELELWEHQFLEEFLRQYEKYRDAFSENGICLSFSPNYCYHTNETSRQYYHTKRKNSDCSVIFRIRLYPAEMSYNQAKLSFMAQEFFSRKICRYKQDGNCFLAKILCRKDAHIDAFLRRYLKKANALKKQQKKPSRATGESILDVFRTFIYVVRYPMPKLTYRGKSLVIFLLIFVLILILLGSYLHYRAQHPNF